MKKLLLLFAVLLSTVSGWAQVPVASQAPSNGKWADGTKWYTIKRNKTNPIALSNADANGYLKLNGTSTKLIDGYWCVVGDDENGYQFYNLQAGTTQTLGAYGSEQNGRMKMYDLDVTTDGSNTLTKTFDIKTIDGQTYAFVRNHGSTNAWWNERDGYLAYWNSDYAYSTTCTGSQYTFEEVDVTEFVDEYKTKAKAALDMISFLGGVDDEKAAIDAVVATNCNAFAEIDAIVNDVAQYVTFRNSHTDVRANHFLGVNMAKGKGNGHGTFNHLLDVWSLKYDGAEAFYLYNVNNEVYLGTPSSNGVLTVTPTAGYTFEVVEGNKVKLKLDGQTLHLNNHAGNGPIVSIGWFLSSYDNIQEGEPASQWYVETDFAAHAATYKTTTLTTLDSWKTLSVVFDGALVDVAKTAINGINITTNYATFAAIDAELKKVTDNVATKYFTFKNTDTSTAARVDSYLAANVASTPKKGYGTKPLDYSAIWRLLSAGGTSFYLYNELNGLYLKTPSSGELVENASEAGVYTFEIVDAATNKAELKCEGQTLHLSNACALMNHDNDDSASRWIIAEYDLKAELQALVAENASNHAPVPAALGQYPTEAYEALVEANINAKTVAEVDAAIDAFKKSKNSPVFMITGVKDYVVGKSVFDDGDAAPGFKTTNAYDKTMWWALDLTTTEVSVSDKVDIYNVGTGEGFWGKPSIRITETNENDGQGIKDDGIFLFYIEGKNDPIHYQASNSTMVSYWEYGATTGSAQKFIYIGDTYELTQLADQYFASGNEVMELYNKYTDTNQCRIADGVNNYHETFEGSFDAAKRQALESLGELKSEAEIAAAKEAIENALEINLPETGKFYYIQSANTNQYLSNVKSNTLTTTEQKSVNNIFYFEGEGENTYLVAYENGHYVTNPWRIGVGEEIIIGTEIYKQPKSFVEGQVGKYALEYLADDNNLHYFTASESSTNQRTDKTHNEAQWNLEPVTSLPFTFKAAALGYATFNAPVAVRLPEGVNAYIGKIVDGNKLKMRQFIGDVVPAETPVLLYKSGVAADTEVSLTIVENITLDGVSDKNDFVGTIAAVNLDNNKNCYSLQKSNATEGDSKDKVGFFKKTSGTKAGFKAWIETPNTTGAARSFTIIFDGDNATGIKEALGLENENVEIYDLSGRRLDKPAKGVNVIGGKLVVK